MAFNLSKLEHDEAGNQGWVLLNSNDDIEALKPQCDALNASGEQARIEQDTETGSTVVYPVA